MRMEAEDPRFSLPAHRAPVTGLTRVWGLEKVREVRTIYSYHTTSNARRTAVVASTNAYDRQQYPSIRPIAPQ